MTTAQAYPLTWPEGWPRQSPQASKFATSLAKALTNVEDSLRRFATDSGKKVEGLIISSNYSLSDRRPRDSGVAVYFTWDGISTCIAVDRYRLIEDNLQAIHHVVEAERTKLRHGGLNLVRAAFRGYAALPPPAGTSRKPWREVLGLNGSTGVDLGVAESAYRAFAKKAHPDNGGSDAAMAELNAAIKAARQEFART